MCTVTQNGHATIAAHDSGRGPSLQAWNVIKGPDLQAGVGDILDRILHNGWNMMFWRKSAPRGADISSHGSLYTCTVIIASKIDESLK